MKGKLLTLVLVGLLNGCGGEEVGTTPPVNPPPSSEDLGQMELWKLELMLEDRASNNAVRENGPSSWSTFFTPDGSVIRPGVGEIQGREAVHDAFMAEIYSNTLAHLAWTPERAEVSRTGDLGYTVGQYLAVLVDSASARTEVRGMYVRLWARQADGGWKVDLEIRNPVSTQPGDTPEAAR